MLKILVNWDYTRKDLMYAFNALERDFNFVFLYQYSGDHTDSNSLKKIFWNDFKSPYTILDEVKPDKIIFHDIESFHQVALNIAAKNRGIETLVLEHGLRRDSEIPVAYANLEKTGVSKFNSRSLAFFLRSLSYRNLWHFFPILAFMYRRKRNGLTVGLNKSKYEFRRAMRYINFTLKNASYIIERDGIDVEKIKLIGDPSFDVILSELNNFSGTSKTADYYLLIDAPFVESSLFKMPSETKMNFYKKLNDLCRLNTKKLIVKLHPLSENIDLEDENIEFVKERSIADLILNSAGCIFIHQSGLIPLAMVYNRAILFDTYPQFNKDLVEKGLINTYNFYNFSPEKIAFKELSAIQKENVIDDYLYATDGKATERLKKVLQHVE